jgi:hypothetical protein
VLLNALCSYLASNDLKYFWDEKVLLSNVEHRKVLWSIKKIEKDSTIDIK